MQTQRGSSRFGLKRYQPIAFTIKASVLTIFSAVVICSPKTAAKSTQLRKLANWTLALSIATTMTSRVALRAASRAKKKKLILALIVVCPVRTAQRRGVSVSLTNSSVLILVWEMTALSYARGEVVVTVKVIAVAIVVVRLLQCMIHTFCMKIR